MTGVQRFIARHRSANTRQRARSHPCAVSASHTARRQRTAGWAGTPEMRSTRCVIKKSSDTCLAQPEPGSVAELTTSLGSGTGTGKEVCFRYASGQSSVTMFETIARAVSAAGSSLAQWAEVQEGTSVCVRSKLLHDFSTSPAHPACTSSWCDA